MAKQTGYIFQDEIRRVSGLNQSGNFKEQSSSGVTKAPSCPGHAESLVILNFGISLARKTAADKLKIWHCAGVGFSGIIYKPLSLRVKQGVVTAVGILVDFAVAYAFKFTGTGQPLSETADAGEHIYELDQGHNSRWGCLPHLRMYLIGAPHQKQKQPVTDCTEQDFITIHNV